MTSAQDFYGQTSVYAYDGDGRRVKRTVAGGATVWQVYGIGSDLLAEYAANASPSTPQKEYGYRGGELLVQATAPVSTGTGLTAQYFDNMNFTDLKLTRTDSTVNFDWGLGSPQGTVGVDTFSVRWEGKVEPLYSQTYTFFTVTDDGVRLWVNNQLIIDKWIDQGPTEWSGQIALTAGQRYDIRMEFYENGGGATAKLLWSSASQPKVAIAQSQLYPAGSGNAQVDLQWLVSDQLGTPRMIIDQSGSLSGMKRHDYLPFGEEIPSEANWRTIARGYVGDNVRQEFTSYERDNESGLDFAEARYYSSSQGRFTSIDPLMASALTSNPQSFNRYSYVNNSPVNIIDPTGMFGICPGGGQGGQGGLPLGSFSLSEQRPEQPKQQQPTPTPQTVDVRKDPTIVKELEKIRQNATPLAEGETPTLTSVTTITGETTVVNNGTIIGGYGNTVENFTGVVRPVAIVPRDQKGNIIDGHEIFGRETLELVEGTRPDDITDRYSPPPPRGVFYDIHSLAKGKPKTVLKQTLNVVQRSNGNLFRNSEPNIIEKNANTGKVNVTMRPLQRRQIRGM